MKFSMLIPCPKCGQRLTIETKGDNPFPNPQCECGAFIWLVQSDMRVSRRALWRAEAELLSGDFSLAIILSAMAVECELAFLYSKWKMLDANLVPSKVTPSERGQFSGYCVSVKGLFFTSPLLRRAQCRRS